MIFSIVLALSTPSATETTTAAPPPPPPPPAEAAPPAPERRICRTTQATGTRLSQRRICRTPSEWRASEQNTQESLSEMQRDANVGAPDAANPGR